MKDIQTLLGELTVEEKAALLEGYQSWMTNAVPRLDIPSVYLTDGPVGVRKKVQSEANGAIGLGTAYPATAFPTSVAIANSWDTENARRMGRAIGEECVHYDVDVLLAPAMNIKRDPRCGRNFEYYSEDPVLAGKMAAAFTDGVQSTGTAACPKHFALNNCENYRYMSDSVVDERAAREIYLKAFEICVKESRPRTMMCAYNKVNGTHCSQSKRLVRDVLRGEWGFDGMMMTDWGATLDRVAGVRVGMDLDMPGNVWENRRSIVDAVKNGLLSKDDLDRAVANVLKLVQDRGMLRVERHALVALFNLCISSTKRISFSCRLVRRAARSPAFSMVGPEVILMFTPISLAITDAIVVLPSPGGPARRTWSSGSPRIFAACMKTLWSILRIWSKA